MKILLAGATGLVGSHVLAQLLAAAECSAVVAPTRRALDVVHAKLDNPLVDFEQLPAQAPWWQADVAICALGTTIKQAGSRAAFRRVDHAYPLAIARQLRQLGATAFALNSAPGADPRSRLFYNRVKGELERDLQALGFASLTLVRPSAPPPPCSGCSRRCCPGATGSTPPRWSNMPCIRAPGGRWWMRRSWRNDRRLRRGRD